MLVISVPNLAQAGWLQTGWAGETSLATIIGSFFSKVKSFFTGTDTSTHTDKAMVQEKPPGLTQANCVPPVPPKPAGIDSDSRYGSLTVAPEASTAGHENIVTISLNSDLEEVNSVSIYTPFPADLDDYVVDWYPKKAPDVSFSRANYSGNGEFRWGLSSITGKYQKYNYGVRIRMQDATIHEQAKNATNADGWKKISYTVSGLKPGRIPTAEKGSKGFYVGRAQKPSLITTIGKDNFKDTFHSGSPSLKPFTVVPNGYFEIKTKSLGQPGTIAIDIKNAKIIGDTKRQVGADETTTWKIQPLTMNPVRLLGLSLTNTCGQDHFVDPAKSATLADFDKFTFPVVYDFEKLIANQIDLSVGARGDHQSLMAGPEGLFAAYASLSTKGDTKVPIPNIPITFRAIYADNPKETVKSIIFKSYDNDREDAGTLTVNTLKDSTDIGSAYVKILGPELTEKDAKRGVVLTVTAKRFPELSARMSIPIVIPKGGMPPPKSQAPTSKPTPKVQTKKIVVQNLIVSADKKLEGIKEGDNITFTAKLQLSDGSSQIPKTNVKWALVGQIGSITPAGVFTAELDEAIAEYGEGMGIVTAIYTDAEGNTFLGKTPAFKVEAFAPDGGEGGEG